MAPLSSKQQDEFGLPISVVILIQTMIAVVYIVPIESDRALSLDVRLRSIEPVLYLIPLATIGLYRWRETVGRWFAVIAPALLVLTMQLWLPIPGSSALLAVATGLAAGLLGPRAAIGVAFASVAGLLVLRSLFGAPDSWQIGIAVVSILTMLSLTVAMYRAATNVAHWSAAYYQQAMQMTQENRANRGALQQTLDDLAHANRQMTLLYEKQSVLQRMAEEAERTKSAFVAKVSHEFRTPLNMIIGLSSVMLENPAMYGRPLPPALLEDLQIIHRNCDHLAGLVDDVLSLSQLQSGNIGLHREELDIARTIDDALQVVRPLIDQKKLRISVEIPPDLRRVPADRTRIRQVILNLLSNAARFTDSGGISVRVDEQKNQVVIAVADSGPGIAPADSERIFEPFCQGSDHVWREKGGSGLGLTISKQFVELHGGRIWLESTIGLGTTFYVSLPLQPPLPVSRMADSWISREWVWFERQNRSTSAPIHALPRLLVYDSTEEIAQGISHWSEHVEIVTADCLDDVMAEARNTPVQALVLGAQNTTDLLPLLQEAASSLPDTPVFGWTLPARISPALRAGADHYLNKPISLEKFRQCLAGLPDPIRRALVADDDEDARLLLARMLTLCLGEIAIDSACDGAQALHLLQTGSYDLVLLDVMMPQMSGLSLLEWLRSRPTTATTPVIVISAQDLYESPPVCRQVVVSFERGISLENALECTLGVTRTLMIQGAELHPAPG